jgi:hypothetical protein
MALGRPIRDITGQRFGALVAVRHLGMRGSRTFWACRCDCGAEAEAPLTAPLAGQRTSCGCRPSRPRIRDLTGQRFGALVAVRFLGRRGGNTMWLCRCDCGAEAEASRHALVAGDRTSCGCRRGRPRSPALARRDRDVAKARSGGETYKAIGKRYGISRQRVMQIVQDQRRRRPREGK